jgi:enamine deaminase RidA (YjgF/YER057c/UK114 family)
MLSLLVSLLMILSPAAPKGPALRFINPPGLAKSPRYSHVAEVTRGKLIFIAGQVSQDVNGNPVGAGDMKAQAKQVLENLGAALAGAGATEKDIVMVTSYVVDLPKNIDTYREVRQELWRSLSVPPPGTTVGVTSLVRPEYLLEVDAIAVVP